MDADATCSREHRQVLTATSKFRWSGNTAQIGLGNSCVGTCSTRISEVIIGWMVVIVMLASSTGCD